MKGLLPTFLALISTWVPGQTLTLTGPVSPVTFPDGPEFATSVLQRPWDMNQLRDIARDYGFVSIGTSGGIWSGVTGIDPNNNTPRVDNFKLFPLLPNFLRGPDYLPYSSFYTNGTPYGHLNPIDADRFTRISFRLSLPEAHRSNVAVWWATTFNRLPEVDGHWTSIPDSQPSFSASLQYVEHTQPTGFRVYDLEPGRAGHDPEQNTFLAYPQNGSGGDWAGNVWGFFLQPSDQAKATDSVPVKVDWIRAYDPVASPRQVITWNSSGLNGSYDSIQIYVDTNNSGYDGDLLIDGLANDGSYTLRTGSLPPGDYWIYLVGVRHENFDLVQQAVSNYSARIRIGGPPLIEITAPSFTSGEDYAATELGNPWDFQDASDYVFTSQMSNIQHVGGVLKAVTDDPIPPFPETDAQIWLNTVKDGQVIPIDSRRYRYVSFRMRVTEEPGYGDLDDKIERGWESRFIWWNSTGSPTVDGSYSKDVPLFEGWRTYSVDLWDNNFLEDPAAIPAVPQLGWEEIGSVRNLRFDPLEAHFPTRFDLDWISLNAENILQNGQYTVKWTITDPDSASVNVKVFADTELPSGSLVRSGTPILTRNGAAPGPDSFVWQPGALSNPVFIRVEVTDGSRVSEALSRVPIATGFRMPTQRTIPVSGDYDGDGRNDLMVYEPSTGNWYLRPSSGAPPRSILWGDASMIPVPGDYNGDGFFDLALYQPSTGNWFIRSLSDGPPITFGQTWGDAGMDPVSGDFNGDGVYDLAVYQRATGNWFIRSLGPIGPNNPPITFGQTWGDAGMIPVSGDFNGDGVADLAVYQLGTGNWFIRSLGPLGPDNPPITFGQTWGDASMTPVPGDYNGDNVADLAVYQRATGMWFIRSLGPLSPDNPPITFGQPWGDAGMDPVPGDYNGDGVADLSVYHRGTGNWFIRSLGLGPPILFGEIWGAP